MNFDPSGFPEIDLVERPEINLVPPEIVRRSGMRPSGYLQDARHWSMGESAIFSLQDRNSSPGLCKIDLKTTANLLKFGRPVEIRTSSWTSNLLKTYVTPKH